MPSRKSGQVLPLHGEHALEVAAEAVEALELGVVECDALGEEGVEPDELVQVGTYQSADTPNVPLLKTSALNPAHAAFRQMPPGEIAGMLVRQVLRLAAVLERFGE